MLAPENCFKSRNNPLFDFARMKFRIISALMLREALGRYGHHTLGFFWIIGEPMVFTTGIMILWSIAGISHGGHVSPIPFALTGYSYITMWRHITGRSIGAVRQAKGLLYHQHISILDSIISLAILETLACFSSFLITYIPLTLLGLCPLISDPLVCFAGFFTAGAFAFGFGLLLAGISNVNEVVRHVTPAFMYMTMPVTGIFTMEEWLPDRMRDLLLWSPLINGIEMFRGGLFGPDVRTYWSFSYLCISSLLIIVLGYTVFRSSCTRDEV